MVVFLDFQMSISHLIEELYGCDLELKKIITKYITSNYFWTMSAILDIIEKAISQLFEEL